MPDEYLSVQEVAALVGRKVSTVYFYIAHPDPAQRLIPDRTYGQSPVFRPETAARFFANLAPQKEARKSSRYLTDKQLARALGVKVAQVRAKVSAGLLVPDRYDDAGRAQFNRATLERLRRESGLLDDSKSNVRVTE